jgi:hypothetical protein
MSICLVVFTADARAIDTELPPLMRYEFANGTVLVQPGRPSRSTHHEALVSEPKPSAEPLPRVQLTSFVQLPPPPLPADAKLEEVPVDAALVSPDQSVQPASATEAKPNGAGSAPLTSADVAARAQLYREIYHSIPFSRAEYDASPSYRHDATMEILFGQMRPTVINRQARTSIDVRMPAMPYGYGGFGSGLFYNRYGIHNGWSPYMYPPYRW